MIKTHSYLRIQILKVNSENIKLILGLKIRQARASNGWSLAQLAELSGMSASYLNEIEKGKKQPKTEKMVQLADVLGIEYDTLISSKLERELAPVGDILRSNILDDLPLELFGIDKGKLVEIISNAPSKVGAFIDTIMQVADRYNLTQENFYFSALRSYQEMHGNHFPELEKEANSFKKKMKLEGKVDSEQLAQVLKKEFGYEVGSIPLDAFPDLSNIRSVYIREAKRILVNDQLAENQKAFLFAKEIGYQHLNLSGDRALMTPWPRATSFDHVLNNSQASYFAGALMISGNELTEKLGDFFQNNNWKASSFLKIMESFNTSPEMFMIRMTNLLTRQFGLNGVFFLRYDHSEKSGRVTRKKELYLKRNQEKRDVEMLNQHCQEWAADKVFPELVALRSAGSYKKPTVQVQKFRSPMKERTYVVVSLSRIMKRNKDTALSVMIGFEQNSVFQRKVAWADDKKIPTTQMDFDRSGLQHENDYLKIRSAMEQLMEQEKNAVGVSSPTASR